MLYLAYHVHNGSVPCFDDTYNTIFELNGLWLAYNAIGDIAQFLNGFERHTVCFLQAFQQIMTVGIHCYAIIRYNDIYGFTGGGDSGYF